MLCRKKIRFPNVRKDHQKHDYQKTVFFNAHIDVLEILTIPYISGPCLHTINSSDLEWEIISDSD